MSTFSVRSISPTEGPGVGATVATIAGTGFESGATVTVDGTRVDATVLTANAISLAMRAHAAVTESGGWKNVTVTVINPLSQAQSSVAGGYTYVGRPVISELLPNIGSTEGGAPIEIRGPGTMALGWVVTVTVDGIVSTIDDNGWPSYDAIYLSMPAHPAGPVEVIVTDRFGQSGSGLFTYAPPATLDFNGDWEGFAEAVPPVPEWGARVVLTIRDNTAVSIVCSVCRDQTCAITAPSLTLDPPLVVANGQFSFAGAGGSITGKILSPTYASGSLNTASCGSRKWRASKK